MLILLYFMRSQIYVYSFDNLFHLQNKDLISVTSFHVTWSHGQVKAEI